MAINAQAPTPAVQVIAIQCKVTTTVKKDWNCCQLEAYCAKVDEIDQQVKERVLQEKDDEYAYFRRRGNSAAANFRTQWNRIAATGFFATQDQDAVRTRFYAECAYQEAVNNNYCMTAEMGSPDHIQEIQACGSATNVLNLRWLNPSVNTSSQKVTGSVWKEYDSSKEQTVSADCCPHTATFCAPPKTSSSAVLP